MPITDFTLSLDVVRVAEEAAIAAFSQVGGGDEKAADQAAVDAMRTALNSIDMDGRIVIGEGERDEAPMLYIGETVGTGKGPQIDIALDPLEGTTLAAKAMANALAVIAFAPRGGLLHAPDTYMDKIAIGPGYPEGTIDLDATPEENVHNLAKAKGVKVNEIVACVLDRPRHEQIISSLRKSGARVHLITDGDVAGVIHTAQPETAIDIYLGQGGAPEGVLACAALKCVGGQFQGRLVFRNDDERGRAVRLGVTDFDRKYMLDDLVSSDAVFIATGVTHGALLKGVQKELSGRGEAFVTTETLVMMSKTRTIRKLSMRRPL
ncbi:MULTISPECIES: class II fructose-bisphosphatase [Asticcacaulis]|uniref:Fructose-1,6-bisphosphatase n=1 Tax=Asticcacaulis endophyticus TaxID=1395890 RepID=A0A918Q9F3_9CAUL|nr:MULTISPECIES: class II fructose-bisphosphatase [Asticcacaulis]WKL56608.1 class II fructose-bisphosphatase [Asticcacaulis sp. ZE23SCel15]GGZ38072.1 fructose-1,6-bisphosphatase [Asticcacaulis endophyticus]